MVGNVQPTHTYMYMYVQPIAYTHIYVQSYGRQCTVFKCMFPPTHVHLSVYMYVKKPSANIGLGSYIV